MGIFAGLGRLTIEKLRPAIEKLRQARPTATNGAPVSPKLGNGGGSYRELQPEALEIVDPRSILVHLGIEILLVPATPPTGFTMGSTKNNRETPVRQVVLSGFGLSKTPITNAQYQACAGGEIDPAKANHPVVNVSWFDAIKFCNWLSIAAGKEAVYTIKADGSVEWDRTKKGFRLPTEAEFEYAARGLDGRDYPWGNELPDPTRANYGHAGRPKITTPVGNYLEGAGPFGHLDLAGNVWKWCWNWYGAYVEGDTNNPVGPDKGDYKVLRGGSLFDVPGCLRGAYRLSAHPGYWYDNIGFFVVEDF
jgi:formylglycine-generating enzyme required for sulfatase activity